MTMQSRAVVAQGSASKVPLSLIFSDPVKLRPVDDSRLREIMASFLSKGQQQPIKVRPNGRGTYVVVFGEHRLEAARRLGWKEISAVVQQMDEHEGLELKVTENAHRNGFVDPWEEGRVFVRLLSERYGNDLNALSDSLGKGTQYLRDRVQVYYGLDPSLRQYLGRQLTVANAISLAKIFPAEKQLEIAKAIVKTRTGGPSGFGGGGVRGAGGKFVGRRRVRMIHSCTCGCGDIHEDKRGSSGVAVDPNEDGIGVPLVLGRLRREAKSCHIEGEEGSSLCGVELPERWTAELPEHFDTRSIRLDNMTVCDECARKWRRGR